jgi:hypothetical protein
VNVASLVINDRSFGTVYVIILDHELAAGIVAAFDHELVELYVTIPQAFVQSDGRLETNVSLLSHDKLRTLLFAALFQSLI